VVYSEVRQTSFYGRREAHMANQIEKQMVIRIYPDRDPERRIVVEDEHGNLARQEDIGREDPLRHIAERHEKLIGGTPALIVIVEDKGTRSICCCIGGIWRQSGGQER
jgi:hypothetical protein